MSITTQDTAIALIPADAAKLHCVYEHLMVMTPDAPPSVVFVSSCKLSDLFHMREARNNTHWTALTSAGAPVIVRIVATAADHIEARNEAIRHARAMHPMPVCNVHGYNMYGAARAIICSNGTTYASQSDAATALGIAQGSISQHLRIGMPRHVGGYTFAYATARGPQ